MLMNDLHIKRKLYWLGISTVLSFQSCINQPKQSICKPFFAFSSVTHHYLPITEAQVFELEEKVNKSYKDERLIDLLIQHTPDTISDSTALNEIDQLGFVEKTLSPYKYGQIAEIFCAKEYDELLTNSCIPIYRDILIFKQQNKIIGIAKICFECNDHLIVGAMHNTDAFGQSGDYSRLLRLLR